ncbi:MAG: succinylglutamate-semialdehyde dehydrogenase [Pseudomonadota bacterium]|nr:succinylglutamate-semialdehyde dehydrogenase [Pseudomonadota bacterium]
MHESIFIDGHWQPGRGDLWQSTNPLTDEVLWQGRAADGDQVAAAVASCRRAFPEWRQRSLAQRMACVQAFVDQLQVRAEALATLISRETGKPLWDARGEVKAMVAKGAISLRAYEERTGQREQAVAQGTLRLRHQPHGVLAVFGPFNFPGHLPNGHIIPALLAGNTIVFKPSELTPAVGCWLADLWHQAGLPAGVLNLVAGDKVTGAGLVQHPQVDGILFTGSARTGGYLHQQYAGQPHKVLALEMGGNNPLLVEPVSDLEGALYVALMSAFVTSGQRCTCARRLLLPEDPWGDRFLQRLLAATDNLPVAAADAEPQPFMGTVISRDAVAHLRDGVQLLQAVGGRVLLPPRYLNESGTLMTPTLVDMSSAQQPVDEELFGPVLQIYRYRDLTQGIALANATRFGLAAGIVTDAADHFEAFYQQARAGIVNCNQPLTGASSEAPFGGVGASGNHRPGAYYAADYCAYPVASLVHPHPGLPASLPPGLQHALA